MFSASVIFIWPANRECWWWWNNINAQGSSFGWWCLGSSWWIDDLYPESYAVLWKKGAVCAGKSSHSLFLNLFPFSVKHGGSVALFSESKKTNMIELYFYCGSLGLSDLFCFFYYFPFLLFCTILLLDSWQDVFCQYIYQWYSLWFLSAHLLTCVCPYCIPLIQNLTSCFLGKTGCSSFWTSRYWENTFCEDTFQAKWIALCVCIRGRVYG